MLLMAKSTISMALFNSQLLNSRRVYPSISQYYPSKSSLFLTILNHSKPIFTSISWPEGSPILGNLPHRGDRPDFSQADRLNLRSCLAATAGPYPPLRRVGNGWNIKHQYLDMNQYIYIYTIYNIIYIYILIIWLVVWNIWRIFP